jgi:SAM-dependent methyltransferase
MNVGRMLGFYRLLYSLGFTPWEEGLAQPGVATQIDGLFRREELGREPPYGRALDLGCGTGIHAVALARRGWEVTGVDAVPKAVARARERVRDAHASVTIVEGDVTRLAAAGIGTGYRLVLDFGTVHGLAEHERPAVGQAVTAVTTADATLLMVAFPPGRRGPMPHGMSRADVEATYPSWTITDAVALDGELPVFMRMLRADPHWFRLRRT